MPFLQPVDYHYLIPSARAHIVLFRYTACPH
jgi:hypothetical protein